MHAITINNQYKMIFSSFVTSFNIATVIQAKLIKCKTQTPLLLFSKALGIEFIIYALCYESWWHFESSV